MSRMHVFCAALSVAAACTLHSAAFAGSGTSGNDAPTLGRHGNSSTDTRHPSESPEQKKARALLDAGIQAFDRAGYAQALPLFQQADEAGHMKAPRYIGLMYLNAFGVKKDEGRAFAEFQKAANRGDITGQFMLATMYEQGMGITQNLDMAIHWYRISAQRGDRIAAPAMSALGRLYEVGRGVPRNMDTAIDWYRRAAATGDGSALAALQRLGIDAGQAASSGTEASPAPAAGH